MLNIDFSTVLDHYKDGEVKETDENDADTKDKAGFKNNVPRAHSFSAGLIVPAGDPTIPGGAWKPAGPNLASGSDCRAGFCYAPENPTVTTMSSDGKSSSLAASETGTVRRTAA